jgi:broad specificity phosphatase PhoE
MAILFTVRTGQTIWEVQSRLDSLAGVPLSDTGRETVRRVAGELAPHKPTSLYASSGQAEQETAGLLGEELGLKVRTEEGMAGIDFGLWQGLTLNEVRRRQPKLHRQWLEAPSGVRPPGGESLQEAQQRICRAVRDILKKGKGEATVIVLRPIALGVLCCRLEKADLDDVWRFAGEDFTWRKYDVNEKELCSARPTRE